jgi:uncharacterized protein
MDRPTVDDLVRTLGLVPHPEGGFYRETYRAERAVETPHGLRPASTAIYFLVPGDAFSALHRIASDELWHHYAGAPLRVVQIDERGERVDALLGRDLAAGQRPQACVPAGVWFGAHVDGDGAWALVGCTVAPGFDFADFELGDRDALLARFPQHAAIIERLTCAR